MNTMHKYLLIALLLASTTACNKWLDLQPQDGITKAEFWKTKEDVKAALYGIYSSLNDGGVEERLFLWGELRGDMVVPTTNATDDDRLVKNMNILSTNDLSNWAPVYKAINNCNLLIDFAGDAKASDPTFTNELYNTYIGEALTVRSLLYFYLVRTFRDIPLKLKGAYKDTDIQSTPQSTPEQVIQQIISDLIKAQEFVPDYHEAPASGTGGAVSLETAVNKGRITKPAVTALLADVYLWNEEYAKAAAEADKILSTARYRLLGQAGLSIYEGSTRETIFEISHKESIPSVMYALVLDARKQFAADNVYINSNIFMPNLEGDVNLRDSRSEGTQYIVGGAISKYGIENPTYYNFQVYRISDVMLIKAEAVNELGRGAEALEILNTLREERGALAATAREVNETDLEGIASYIIEERARELAFEGKRWFDLLRLAKRNSYSNLNILVELVSKNADDALKQSAINKIGDINSHYLPISENELFRDPALKQNPFYLK